MNTKEVLGQTAVGVCTHQNCTDRFLLKKHRNLNMLCKKHRSIGYKKAHVLKKKIFAHQLMESKKAFKGAETLISQPLSSYLSQVLCQKRRALMTSPEVIEIIKNKQNTILNSASSVANPCVLLHATDDTNLEFIRNSETDRSTVPYLSSDSSYNSPITEMFLSHVSSFQKKK